MKNLLNSFLALLLLSAAFHSCIDKNYDLDNIDDNGNLSPALILPIGSLRISASELVSGAGIGNALQIETDTIYVVYEDFMTLKPITSIPGFVGDDVWNIPPGIDIQLGYDGGSKDIEIDIFENLAASGSELYLANPQIYCTMNNYVGADIEVNINGITSHKGAVSQPATFRNGNNSYGINIASAPTPHSFSAVKETFDKTNGQMNRLFEISPERISYDFSVDISVPDDGKQHFILKDKFVDVFYEVKIPLTFGAGTRIVRTDTMDFDLSGDDFINNLDELRIWIDCKNRFRAAVDLEVLFLDEYKREIPSIQRGFTINPATPAGGANQRDAQPSEGTFEIKFNSNEIDDAKRTSYVALKYVLKTDQNSGDVNIHPSDYISLKLDAYATINLEF